MCTAQKHESANENAIICSVQFYPLFNSNTQPTNCVCASKIFHFDANFMCIYIYIGICSAYRVLISRLRSPTINLAINIVSYFMQIISISARCWCCFSSFCDWILHDAGSVFFGVGLRCAVFDVTMAIQSEQIHRIIQSKERERKCINNVYDFMHNTTW